MLSPDYLLDKTPPPSALRQFFDQQVLPVAIDAAGSLEALLEDVARATRRRPVAALGIAFASAFLLSALAGRRPARRSRGRRIA